MKVAIIGQRGSGKTSFLMRCETYFGTTQTQFFDLDFMIEKKYSKKITEIFTEQGEAVFREYELNTFLDLTEKHSDLWISVGGGFPVEKIPSDFEVIWLQRQTDQYGRIFTDRPRLESQLSALDEYQVRAQKREIQFRKKMSRQYLVPEGLKKPNFIEKKMILSDLKNTMGCLTLLPEHFATGMSWENVLRSYSDSQIDLIELRDDLLSSDQIQTALQDFESDQILYSYRSRENTKPVSYFSDWALELGPPAFECHIISLHERQETLHASIDWINQYQNQAHLKLAIEISDFAELERGFLWQQEDPEHRSFLPRSSNGRWLWFRLYMKNRQKINFFKEGLLSSANDQPSLFQWLSTPYRVSNFAAVLGSPVDHSLTPQEQAEYFFEQDMPVFAIDITEKEWPVAFSFLKKLGLTHAAVTSPLKVLALNSSVVLSEVARRMQATNTLWISPLQEVHGHNTDLIGFEALSRWIPNDSKIVVWGGGGTLQVIREQIPRAQFYSVRTRMPREGSLQTDPDVLVWAGGETDWKNLPTHWKPQIVIDLNYRDDSIAREYALFVGARYESGLQMFIIQADEQRAFWSSKL